MTNIMMDPQQEPPDLCTAAVATYIAPSPLHTLLSPTGMFSSNIVLVSIVQSTPSLNPPASMLTLGRSPELRGSSEHM